MDDETRPVPTPVEPLPTFTCRRCGFVYSKQHDYEPYLCHRCTRYISKKVFSLMNQVVPPVSRTERSDI